MYVKTLTGVERMQWSTLLGEFDDHSSEYMMPAALAFTLVDASGKRLFDGTMEDAKAIAGKSGAAIFEVFKVADEINTFTEKALEDVEGN